MVVSMQLFLVESSDYILRIPDQVLAFDHMRRSDRLQLRYLPEVEQWELRE